MTSLDRSRASENIWWIIKKLYTEVEVASGGYLPSHEAAS